VSSNDRNVSSGSSGVKHVFGKTKRDGREFWRVAANGQIRTITTTASSTATMDEAVLIYDSALRRLADR
jgi:hypothetical protein